jgi:hypothetical protein
LEGLGAHCLFAMSTVSFHVPKGFHLLIERDAAVLLILIPPKLSGLTFKKFLKDKV